MSKYETMVVIRGSLKDTEAKKALKEVLELIKTIKKVDVTDLGHKALAYPIDDELNAYYYVLNFETEEKLILAEFRRLLLLNKNVIRHLIINLEKDYGYKATVNPKKVAKSQYRAEVYKSVQEKIKKDQESYESKAKDFTPVKVSDI
ncbi:MAG: 30S ribosomal protein S6 [Mycoplasmoidaceae bacterium]